MINKIKSLDQNILSILVKYSNNISIDFVSFLGNIVLTFFIITIIFFLPVDRAKEISIISMAAFIMSTLIVFLMKYIFRRKRYLPDKLFINKLDPYSFPSGHISRLSGLIITTCPIIILQVLFGTLAIIVSLARMIKGYHYLSDCFVGFLIGIFSGGVALYFSDRYLNIILDFISKYI